MNNWLIFALIGPILWSSTNVIDGFVRKKYIQNDYFLSIFCAFFKIISILLLLLFADFHLPTPSIFFQMLLAGLLWGLPVFLYFQSFEHDEASTLAIYIQLLPIPTLIIAHFFIGEVLTSTQFIGFSLMLLGGILAAMKKTQTKFHLSKGLLFMGIAVIVWAAADVYFKALADSFTNYVSAFIVFLLGSFLSGFILIFMPISGHKERNIKQYLNPMGLLILNISIFLAVVGSLSFSYALTIGKASLVTLATGLQPFFAILWAFLLKKMLPEVESDKMNSQIIVLKFISLALLIGGLALIQI